jgi:hypothetical protein
MADPFTKWPPDEVDLYWLAGILEGEGSFFQLKRWPGVPMLSLGMYDRDVISRAAKLCGVQSHRVRLGTGKTRYQFMIRGRPRAGRIMSTLYALMGTRRQRQIREALRFPRGK